MSPYSFLVMLLIMVILPTILYTLFFLINCPPTPSTFFRRRFVNSGDLEIARSKLDDQVNNDDERNVKNDMELIRMSSELGKEEECPVCLSIFIDGEELRQLKNCKHLFHKGCIDKWLSTHFNCPICRAFVINHFKSKEKGIRVLGSTDVGMQGLPHPSGLV